MLISDETRGKARIVVGVDTHKDTHHAAVLDLNGQVLGDREFPATMAGYQDLHDWAASHGVIDRVGIELTGSYGAGLTRYLSATGVTTVEVNTTDRATRARLGKDDTIDAIAAARKVLSGMATATPKDTTGTSEAIRVLSLVRDSAVKQRSMSWNQFSNLLVTAPAALREQFAALTPTKALRTAQALRPDPTRLGDPAQAVKTGLRRLATRIGDLDQEIKTANTELATLVEETVPTLVAQPRIGTHTAAQLIVTIASNPDRVRTSAQFARLCGVAPIPVSSGKTNRMRLHRGGDRQANRALHLIVIGRLKDHQPTRDYMAKKLHEGKSKRDAIRCLKRYVAREVFHHLTRT